MTVLPFNFLGHAFLWLCSNFCLSVLLTAVLNLVQRPFKGSPFKVVFIQHRALCTPNTPKHTHRHTHTSFTSNKELPHHILLLWNHMHSRLTVHTYKCTALVCLQRKMQTWKARGGTMEKCQRLKENVFFLSHAFQKTWIGIFFSYFFPSVFFFHLTNTLTLT